MQFESGGASGGMDRSWPTSWEGSKLPDAADADQQRRVAELDIHPSGPLAGQGGSPAKGEAGEIENRQFEAHRELVDGLAKFGMRQERRALRMRVIDLAWRFPDLRTRELEFSLGTGSYATSVLRELIDYQSGQ